MNALVIRNAYHIGGAELYYLKLASALKKNNLPLKITLVSNNIHLLSQAKAAGLKAIHIDVFNEELGTKKGIARILMRLPVYLYLYLKIIILQRFKSELDILLFSGTTEKLILTPFARIMGIRTIWIEHGRVFNNTRSKIIHTLYKLSAFFTHTVLAESQDTYQDLIQTHSLMRKTYVLGTGIDTAYYSPPKHKNKSSQLRVSYISSVTYEKGVFDFIETARRVQLKNKDVFFTIIGEGPQLHDAIKLVDTLQLMNIITFLGYQENTKQFLRTTDIFIFPIKHPGGLSLSLGEAMAMGVVPIVSNVGGNSEYVNHGVNGFIISNSFAQKASEYIFQLFNNRKKLYQLSKNARITINNKFTEARWANLLYAHIEAAVHVN